MLEEGNILFFDPFYFKNGQPAKPKFFVVLKTINTNSVLASLPTSKDSIPKKEEIDNGCIELPDINFNCFVISNDIEVTTCGKKFKVQTHLYGYQIDIYENNLLQELHPLENTDFFIWGKMKKELYNDLINCLKNSRTVKRKYKKIL